MKRVLILGSKGMAGHVIFNFLKNKRDFILGQVSRTDGQGDYSYNIDVTDLIKLDKVLDEFSPDVVINCLGVLNKDAEENPDKAIYINSYLPHFLAKKVANIGSRLIHISTDCVFSGGKGNYLESDFKDGKGVYAQSKALGEVEYGNNLTIRTSIIGPELKHDGIGLLHWFLKNNNSKIKGYTNVFWSGVSTLQLAKSIYIAINNKNIRGIVHLTNGIKISKYDLLEIFKNVFNRNLLIEKDLDYKLDKSLALGLQTKLLGPVPGYKMMLKELKEWIEENKGFYSHNYNF